MNAVQSIAKTCCVCRETKPLERFGPHTRSKDGLQYRCKDCNGAQVRIYRESNREAYLTAQQGYRQRNLGSRRAACRTWYENNREYAIAKATARPKERHKVNSYAARYRAAKLQATPTWANIRAIERMYGHADALSALHGVPYEVDHLVPLQSEFVCGLHVHHNLEVKPTPMNRSKGNRTWPDMWEN